jgi:hypothetical protein
VKELQYPEPAGSMKVKRKLGLPATAGGGAVLDVLNDDRML